MAIVAGLIVLTFAACAFAIAPMRRNWTSGAALLSLAIVVFVIGTAWGAYYLVGSPWLALREVSPDLARQPNAQVSYLIAKVRKTPRDEQAWTRLGNLYMQANAPLQAAAAYRRAIDAAGVGRLNPALEISLAEALVAAAGGKVDDEALRLFQAAYAQNPFDPAARYFMGQGFVERGDVEGGLAYWRSLLADTSPTSSLYPTLSNRIAEAEQLTNDPGAPARMVDSLAAKLKSQPHDLAGWERLIRSYTVLGQEDRAREALGSARHEFANDRQALAELEQQVRQLDIE